MEALVDSMILASAKTLGLAVDSVIVSEARQTGLLAIQCGYSVDDAFAFARLVMTQSAVRPGVEAA